MELWPRVPIPDQCVVCKAPAHDACYGCRTVAYCSQECRDYHANNGHAAKCETDALRCALQATFHRDRARVAGQLYRMREATDAHFACERVDVYDLRVFYDAMDELGEDPWPHWDRLRAGATYVISPTALYSCGTAEASIEVA